MADFPTTEKDVLANFLSVWADRTDVVMNNTDAKVDERQSLWVRASVREVGGGRSAIGNVVGQRKYERQGFLAVQVFELEGQGTLTLNTRAEEARTLMENKRLNDDVVFQDGSIRPQPPDGKWLPVLVEVLFTYTERK